VDVIAAIAWLGLAAVPIALLGGWLAGRGDRGLGSLTGAATGDAWWRSTMPWPHGVQESVDVHWHFADREPAASAVTPEPPPEPGPDIEPAAGDVTIDRTRLQPHIRVR
jgi:hypothetical protein